MEDELDAISRSLITSNTCNNSILQTQCLSDLVTAKSGEIDAREVCRVLIGQPDGQPEVFVRVGLRYPSLSKASRRASIPDQTPPIYFRWMEARLNFGFVGPRRP